MKDNGQKMRSDAFETTVELVAETDPAILVDDGDVEVWLPKSQIEFERKPPSRKNTERPTLIITAPSWLLEEKGLV